MTKMDFISKCRTCVHVTFLTILQILIVTSQIPDPGGTPEIMTVVYNISEELPPNSPVGTLPIYQGYTYHIQDQQTLFQLNENTGQITTKVVIDREKLSQDTISFFVTGTSSSNTQQHPINVRIRVLDINDNFPTFPKQTVTINFLENIQGSQVSLSTASDPDSGNNGNVSNYGIVTRDDDNKFEVVYDTAQYGEVLIVRNLEKLNREDRSSYELNISVQDHGSPPKFGYLQILIHVDDANDNPPIFDQSQYKATINESAPVGSLVIHVAASDDDIGVNSQITYSLQDDSGQFQIDPRTGEVTTKTSPLYCYQRCDRSAGDLDCEPYSCILTVTTTDGGSPPLSGRAYVSVKVIDENNHAPSISIRHYPDSSKSHSSISENQATPYVVALVTVTDADPGTQISALSIVSGNEKGHFEMKTTSDFKYSSVRLISMPDRERISMYNLTIVAIDSGNPPKSSAANLIVFVIDVNDHVPWFTKLEYRITLGETMAVGSFVESLTANDEDSGQNADLTYIILSGNEHNWFKIDDKTGLLTVNARMHYDIASTVVMNISVQDGGPIPFKNYTKVIISILDENDKAPMFADTTFNVTLDENKNAGYEILMATATDADSGPNGTVTYQLHSDVQLQYPNTFSVNSLNGRLTTQKVLDREESAFYVIKIVAKDQGPQPLSSTATVNLKVIDQNDEKPVFYPEKYFVNFEESQPIGATVVAVTAFDKDSGINAKITYSFASTYPEFSLNPDTGVIKTAQVLRKNVRSKYELFVQATDPNPAHVSTNTAKVEILVTNSNDIAPVFNSAKYTYSITEDSGTLSNPTTKTVGTVTATANGQTVRYSITAGDPTGVFSINEQGTITSVTGIDREVQAEYRLTVIAYTDNKSSVTIVTVTVNDVNDHAPKFELASQQIDVPENLPVGTQVYLASAIDHDDGSNSIVTYTLHDTTSSGLFGIDPASGMIILRRSLQQLTSGQRSYRLTINATDGGTPQLSSSQQITLNVADVNDHTPVFSHSGYEISLKESTPVNDQFLTLNAVDYDLGENARITYNITRGNDGSFGIFPNGALYIAKQLDREERDHYQLTVHATDNGIEHRNSPVNITINVLDDNDNKPLFVNTTYTMSILENSMIHTVIGSVSATDADIGRNAEISYYLKTGNDKFSIDPQTGEIRSLAEFDREQLLDDTGKNYYSIEVTASDNGLDKLQDLTTVNVYILDDNDSPPIFDQIVYRQAVSENIPKYSPVVKVSATDQDSGINQALTYSIISGNEDELFVINSGNGQITLNGVLDRESLDNYVLKVLATDSGIKIQNSATCTVSVKVLDVNDNSPLFAQSVYTVSLSEFTIIGDEVIQFVATDTDLGINAQILYSITGGDGTFIIDPNTGKLYLNRELDYETKHEYKLNVSASDKGTPSVLPTYASLTVKIKDENDNAPTFINTPDMASITENAQSFHSIMKVSAQDIDSDVNGQIIFSISNQEPVDGMFTIDPEQGKISFSGVEQLDREKVSSYSVTVVASDKNVTSTKSTEKTIIINVMDENDETPRFISTNGIRLNYPVSAGSFATILAEDPDEGNNGKVMYTLLTQNNYFNLDPSTGALTLQSDLPTSDSTFTLRVKASDNGMTPRTKEMDFTVILVPTSGGGPQFERPSYSVQIQENESIGKSLIRVNTSPYANEKFYITGITSNGKSGQLFQIDENSGVLSALTEIDREVHGSSMTVTVCAVRTSQSSPTASCTQVTITVTDLNDTPPKFGRNRYTVDKAEDTSIGALVTTVTATDADSVGTLSLSIRSGADGKFSIDNAGRISLLSPLDRETQSKHTLVIVASDGIHTATATVVVTVTDVNDTPPQFTKPLYTFDVSEDTGVGTTLGRVEAVDPDEGISGQVYYTLKSEWGSDLFNLDLQKGTFTLLGNLDFEEVQLYTLEVRAEDRGNPKLTSTVTVFMNIKDNNDNEPVFDPMSYSAEVKEDVAIGTSVAMVSATDIDSGLNGRIFYEIFDGDINGQFGVGTTNGTLFIRQSLDRETIANYTLSILAIDQAEPPEVRRTTTTEVKITVADVNDNAPVFVTPSVMSVPEDKQLNNVAFTVKVHDKDVGQNSVVTFSLSHHPDTPFRMNPSTGEMLVNTILDRETRPNYTVTVTAFDNGNPPKSSTQSLTIKISDVNDNKPVFNPVSYTKAIAENIEIGRTLLAVTATDQDEGLNGNVRYFIVAGDDNFDFAIDPSSGVIRVQKNLDYERVNTYKLKIQAEDSGSVTQSAFADVTISILDINDNKPVFLNSPYYPLVLEEAENLPVQVLQVSARDQDSPPNNIVTYGFREGNVVDGVVVFKINSSSGEITCLRKLDREVKDRYELTVFASDSGFPSKTGTGSIVINVQDINDHAPEFEHSSIYVGHIAENLPGNSPILTVKATDKDSGANSQIIYSLENNFDGKFSVHPNTGELSAVKSLDREETAIYNLKLVARDSGLIPKMVTADVTVIVDDKNDDTPQFERDSYQQTVNNPTQQGDFVMGVTALDHDIGENGQVIYSLTGTDKLVINSRTGIVTAHQTLSNARETFSCIIKAEDQGEPRKSSMVNVTVTVSDISSLNRPTFTSFPSSALVLNENTAAGHLLTKIQATSNVGGSVSFHIAGGNVGKSFTIDQSTGEVTVYDPVDYEMTQSFDLWIEARDVSNAALSAYKRLVINIQDLNDNTPRFSQPLYSPVIPENAFIGSTVVQIIALDGDSGSNGRLTYRLSSDDTTFRIDPNSGLITTMKSLDRETVDTYSLIVEAVDQGNQPLTGSTTVRVIVSDINDNRPVFSQNFNIEIPEDLAVGSFVIQVTASDADIGDNAKITYNIIGNPYGKFKIDPTSGNITLLGKLDAELYDSKGLQINITASDGANLPHAYVIVYVTDVNDNAPKFTEPLRFSLIEGMPAGTVVGRVSATDSDISTPNNQLHFSFKLSSSEFSIDSMTGEIKSKMEMVYVHNSEVANVNTRELIVVATDHGSPPRSSEAIIHIDINDANDHAPVFEPKDYYSAVPDNVVVGDLVMTIVAKDEHDYGINAEVQYFKEGGSGEEYFYVNKLTGDITIAKSLQGLIGRDFNLIVKAEDKGIPPKNVTQEIRFTITGVNQHNPVFTTTDLQTTVPENTIIGSSIAKVSAHDDDVSGPNNQVTYHIIGGDPNGQFLIDMSRGDISVHKKLDYETNQQHHLKIMAKDQGLYARNSTIVFIVHIRDINDNSPVFNSTRFVASVFENTPSGHIITTITATDADSGQNAIIEYSLQSDIFMIDQSTGSIRTRAPLDYERTTSYNLIILAVNPGTQLKNATEVIIEVKGVNEFYPQFIQKDYPFSIKESIPIGTVLGSVVATDDDQGEDGIVYYYLIGPSNSKGFKLDYKTGAIIVSGRPDYESSPTITLKVMAKNWGSIKGGDTDECNITITVEDANDPPVFSQPLYQASVDENSGPGISIIQVSATDSDRDPSDKQFSFMILNGNQEQSFSIDSSSGWIKTTGSGVLDRETKPVYNVTVAAVDNGIVPQTGTAMVQITLLDKNDNGPSFTSNNLTGYIMENQVGGVSVISLYDFTTDSDLPPNQGPYQYRLQGTSNYFQVNEVSGLVTSKTTIDREQTPMFDLAVVVSDGGVPTQSSTLTFSIVVRDENDNPSSPRAVLVQMALFDGRMPTGSVADVRPLDPDLVGNYSCEINSQQNTFIISGNSCNLKLLSYPDVSSSMIVSFSGSDGKHEKVSYNAEFSFIPFDNRTLDRTVILRVENILPGDFVATKQTTLKQYLSGLFGQLYTVLIYNVKSFDDDSLVFIAVQGQGGTFVLHDILKQQIVNKKTDIETEVGIKITAVSYTPCTSKTCRSGECLNHIDVHSTVNVVDSDRLIVSSPDLLVSYRCSCPPQFTGTHCETPVSPCGDGHCQNGGFCVANKCDCPSGWTGTFCQADVNECLNTPCQNGAACNNTLGSFQCICREGFTGNLCQNGADHCLSNPCVQGTCHNMVGGYQCRCPFSTWGEQCQHSSVGFSVGSYLQFSSTLSSNDNMFDVTIATVKSHALILYNPAENAASSEFLALEIIGGKVRFSFNLGDLATTHIDVPKNVSTGEWFRIQVHRSGEHAQLRVSACPTNGGICPECQDATCVRSASQISKKLNLGSQPVTIGGIENIDTALARGGQIQTHDFVGCIREFKINNEDYLGIKKPLKEFGVDHSGCPRQQGQSSCSAKSCSNGGICVDEWSTHSCRCQKGYHGNTCQQEFKPFGFGSSGYVTFRQKDTYQRDVLVSQSRRRRAPGTSSIFIRFRTTSSYGMLYYADRGTRSSILYIQNKALKYTVIDGNSEVTSEVMDASISDGSWHNATVIITGTTVSLTLDSQSMTFENIQSAFPFSDVYITQMSLGGSKDKITVGNNDIPGFGGCISEFEMDEKPLPMNGTTDRFVIETSSGVENGCSGLCSSCSGSCSPNGEIAVCKQVQEEEPLGVGVIVVIAFFGVLLIVIVVIFLVYRFHRQRREKSGKQNGHVNKSFGSGHSPEDSGYGENDFIHHHVQTGLRTSPYAVSNGHVPNRPDLINANGRTSGLPLEMDDGTVIIDNGDIQINGNEDAPELYDLENASSIAPSDIDVSYYYGASRHGKGQSYRDNYKKHLLTSKSNGHGPPSQQWNSSRDSPGALRMQTTAMLNRNSPANVQNQQHLNRPNRNSPSQYGSRLSPMDPHHRQSPHMRASPLVQSSARGTPLSDIHHGRADSDHSIVSHHSHHSISSTSSASRLPPLPNGNINRGRKPPTSQRPVKGLTIEEVDKLNHRPTRPSPVSMLEAVSSSTEGHRQQQQFKIRDHLDDGAMIEPLDSSSDESANDSFTCSEFEYENDKGRNDFDQNAMIYSKVAEVDNENDDFNMNHNMRNNDGLDSNGSSFASSDGGKRASGAPLNGAINWDYFTDWGPSFEKLVGVFKDIASLPDGDENANSNMDCRTETEEYV